MMSLHNIKLNLQSTWRKPCIEALSVFMLFYVLNMCFQQFCISTFAIGWYNSSFLHASNMFYCFIFVHGMKKTV